MGYRPLPRRTFLRGAGGLAIGLPVLEIMLDDHGTALADGAALPCRYFVGFGGFTYASDSDDSNTIVYVPDQIGPDYDLKAGIAPLADHGNVKDEVTIVSGLDIPLVGGGGDPSPAGGTGFHWYGPALLSGHRSYGTDFVAPEFPGPTSDQVVAAAIGTDSLFGSLHYRVQALFYNLGGSPDGRDVLSVRDVGGPLGEVVQPLVSPRLAFESLFAGFVPTDPDQAAAQAFELAKRRSILDVVDRRMDGRLGQLGAADRQRLARHLEEIRELEQRLETMGPMNENPACEQPPHPGDDPPLGQEFGDHLENDVNKGYSGEEERALVFTDLVHMAFVCDLTRVVSLMYTMFQSFMNTYQLTGHNKNFHELHHRGATSQLQDMMAWHVGHFGSLVAKLRDTPEGSGSVLDNCAMVFLNEGGRGLSYPANESSHSAENMACLVAGGAGGLRRGEHLVAPAGRNHPVNVLITLMNAVGVPTTSLGEVTGSIPELLA
jgi:hypothetical protein